MVNTEMDLELSTALTRYLGMNQTVSLVCLYRLQSLMCISLLMPAEGSITFAFMHVNSLLSEFF